MDFFDTIDIKIIDFIDIALVAFLFYYTYKLVKGTVAINIFIGIVIIYMMSFITKELQLNILSNIFGKFIGAGFFLLIIVFQQEIRKFLLMVGSANFTKSSTILKQLKLVKKHEKTKTNVTAILNACNKMSHSNTGCLIVLERINSLDFLKSTGDLMDIEVNEPIIESIFFKNNILHDGAIIIKGNSIVATRAILPVTNKRGIPLKYGLRHRAAIGITENTDALALIVSEENGTISYIKDGTFIAYESLENLKFIVTSDLS